MYDINVVAKYNNILSFKALSNFKMDLGKSFVDVETKSINIKDRFVAYMLYDQHKNVQKIGSAGKINFYYDLTITHDDIEIYFDTTKYIKPLDNNINIDKWLKNILIEIRKELKPSA